MINIIVAPISGGHFPVQLAAYKKIVENKLSADFVCAGSGGTVASYCWMGCDNRLNLFDMIIGQLSSDIFVKRRSENIISVIPEKLSAMSAGAFYNISDEAPEFLHQFFEADSIQKTEIWVAAINQESGRVGLFCNKCRSQCMLQPCNRSNALFNSEKFKYLNGNIEYIAGSILASSAIPFYVEPSIINEQKYIDCGTQYASSLTPLQIHVRNVCKNKNVHILYLSAYDTELSARVDYPEEAITFTDLLNTVPCHFVKGLMQQDRAVAYNLISRNRKTHTGYCCIEELPSVLRYRERCNSSLIEFYPIREEPIDIFDFEAGTLGYHVDRVELGIRIWWSGSQTAFDNIDGFVHREMI